MKRYSLFLVVLLGGFLLIGADGCSSDPNVEGAKLDLRNKDYDRAIENIDKALETNPDNADAYELKGQILQEQAFTVSDAEQHTAILQEMMTSYNRSVDLDPTKQTNVENQLKMAYFNEFNRGIQAFNRAQQVEGNARSMEFGSAAVYFGNASSIFPDSTGAYVNQAFALISSGKSQEAVGPLEMAIEKGDQSEETFIYLSDLYRSNEQYDKGIALLENARPIYPENDDITAQLMNFYVVAGRADEALGVYEEAVADEPGNKLYRYNYGSLLLDLDRYDEAVEQLSKAVELDANYSNAQYNLGAAYVNQAVVKNEEATTIDDELREKRPELSQDEINRMQGQIDQLIEEKRGLFQMAIGPLERAKELTEAEGGEPTGICQALFQSYVQTNQTQKAEALSECAGYDIN